MLLTSAALGLDHYAVQAQQALDAMKVENFHVLLSDIGFPPVDGYELIREIRKLPAERGGKIPAAAVTGFARNEDSQRALAEGFQNHLSKPIEPKELIELVATLSTYSRSGATSPPSSVERTLVNPVEWSADQQKAGTINLSKTDAD